MTDQRSSPPPTYVEKNIADLTSTQQVSLQQPAGIAVASSSAQPILIYTEDTDCYQNYNTRAARVVGICQIVAGALAIIFQITDCALGGIFCIVGAAIWTGIMFIVAGGLAVGSAAQKKKCLIVGAMVMSIISAVFVNIIFVMAIMGSIFIEYNYYETQSTHHEKTVRFAFDGVMICIGLFEFVCAITQSILCCRAACCGQRTVIDSNQCTIVPMNQDIQPMIIANQSQQKH